MQNIVIKGLQSSRREKEVIALVERVVGLLRFKQKAKLLQRIHIEFKASLSRDDIGNYLNPLVNSENRKINSNIHVIRIKKGLSKNLLKRTLIHELTHLKQKVTGKFEWVQYRKNGPIHAYWNKENIGIDRKLDILPPDELPWEIEAKAMEERFWTQI